MTTPQSVVDELWSRVQAATGDILDAITVKAQTTAGDATQTGADRAHVDGQVEAIDTAFTESVPPYLQPDSPGGLRATYANRESTVLVSTPEKFGAVGDGVADDTAAVQAAIDEVRDAGGGTVHFTSGRVYKVTTVRISPGTILDGYGATLSRPDMVPNWTRMVTTEGREYVGQEDSDKPIVVRGLILDGNLENQGAYQNYELQQTMLLMFRGAANSPGRGKAIVEDVTVKRCASDGVHVSRNFDVVIRNLTAIDCFRGGVVVAGGNSVVHVDRYRGGGNIVGAHIDVEVDSAGYNGSRRTDIFINDMVETTRARQSVNLDGFGGARIELTNSRIMSGLHTYGGTGGYGASSFLIRDCVIDTYAAAYGNTIYSPHDITFERCTFRGHVAKETEAAHYAVNVYFEIGSTSEGYSNLRFLDCTWEVATGAEKEWVAVFGQIPPRNSLEHKMEIIGGRISSDFARGIQPRAGRTEVGGGVLIDARLPLYLNNDGFRPSHTTVEDMRLGPNAECSFFTHNHVSTDILEHRDTVIDESKNVVRSVVGWTRLGYRGRRIIMVSAPPVSGTTTGVVGDIARLKTPIAGSPYEWVCTKTGAIDSIWKVLTTIPA